MIESISEKVSRFNRFTNELIEVAVNESNRAHDGVHSKILLCSIFDSLSKNLFRDISSNGERFKKLIQVCSGWHHSQKISLLHMVRFFEIEKPLPDELNKLKEYCLCEYKKHFPISNRLMNRHVTLDRDLDFNLAYDLWPKNNKKPAKISGIHLENFKHENLLWLYRNSVVHEYRSPGRGSELSNRSELSPYYLELPTVATLSEVGMSFTNNWELIYPVDFFKVLCQEALSFVSTKHLNENTSPFEVYEEGTYWLPNFNE